jgi:parallel beta helix pectate lyase-like protein
MSLSRTTISPPPPHRPLALLPEFLTAKQAAALANTNPEAIWHEIRAGRIRFSLFSGNGHEGTSVLVRTEDLIRIGMLQGSVKKRPPRQTSQRPRKVRGSAGKPFRGGAYGGLVILAVFGLLALATVVPTLTPTSASRPRVPAALRVPKLDCKTSTKRNACRPTAASRSRTPKASTIQSRSHPHPQSPLWGGSSTVSGGTVSGPRTSPLPRQTSPVQSPPPSGYWVPQTIASDCSRDVRSDLLGWMKTVPNNTTLNFSKGACYRIDGSLVVSERVGLTFNGNGATFDGRNNASGRARHWWVQHSSRITLRNMTVRGANPRAGAREGAYVPAMEGQAAYGVWGSENVLLDKVQAYDMHGDFVEVSPMWIRHVAVASRHVTVRNSHFERSGRQGISVTGAQDVLIQNNYISGVPHDIFDLEPEVPPVAIDNVRFIGNRTGAVWLVWFANHGVCNAGVSNITISDNIMEEMAINDYAAVWIKTPDGCARRGPYTIEHNTFMVRQPKAAVDATLTHDLLFRGNRVRFQFGGPGGRTRTLVDLKKSSAAAVMSNTVAADPRDHVVFVKADGDSDYEGSGNKRV